MNTSPLTIAILQLNFKVGDITFNQQTLINAYHQAVAQGATLVVAPELAISGYPPKDNLLHKAFIKACEHASQKVATAVGNVPLAFGTPLTAPKRGEYGQLATNSYIVAHNGSIVFRTDKRYPAQGGVFDEWRVHVPGNPNIWEYQGLRFGFPICEDIWHPLIATDVDVFIVPNGSPTYVGKPKVRHEIVASHVAQTGKPMLYFNHVGGQDEHVFDGGAFYVNPGQSHAVTCTPYWQESISLLKLESTTTGLAFSTTNTYQVPTNEDFILDALVLGTRDYLLKSSSLRKVVIGISGGVDSAVVLGLAKLVMESAGLNPAENIIAVSMPSRHNSPETQGFAQTVCNNMGIPLHWWPIGSAVEGLTADYQKIFGKPIKTVNNAAYENTQSRERGQVLMAISNRENALLLSTGNKSEMAMGFATLYGDMNGGFNPLKTLYKTQVYQLGHTINRRLGIEAIPPALIHQKPSAELDDNQLDENSLPPYTVLDTILTNFMDEKLDVAEIMELNNGQQTNATVIFVPENQIDAQRRKELLTQPPFRRWWTTSFSHYDAGTMVYHVSQDCVVAVAKQLFRMRFKRYQACPGVTITPSSFDDGENYPIANGNGEWLI